MKNSFPNFGNRNRRPVFPKMVGNGNSRSPLGRGASDVHKLVKWWSPSGQNHKIMISVLGQSILVNDILYLRLFNHLDITPSKYRNGEFNLVSCSNLCWSLGIMHHMLIHGPTRFWPLWCLIGGFIRGFSHPTRHTGLRENAIFGFQIQNLECIKEK